MKSAERITKLVVGLNPGKCEFVRREFFIGPAGQWLRGGRGDDRYRLLWKKLGDDPTQVLVTNLVKISTDTEKSINFHAASVQRCINQCFLPEILSLQNLSEIYLLGEKVRKHFPYNSIKKAANARSLRLFSIPHPSHCWVVRKNRFEQDLSVRLERPIDLM